jgi:hypothetical protein
MWRGDLWALVAAGAALAASPGWSQPLTLEVTRADSGQMVLCAAMAAGEEFVLSFLHSVNRRPVFETLRVEADHLVIVGARYDSLGAGMPEASTEQGTLRWTDDGWLEWTVSRPVPEVVVRIGRVAGHTLLLKGRHIPLADLSEPGTPLAFRAGPQPIPADWKGRCLR